MKDSSFSSATDALNALDQARQALSQYQTATASQLDAARGEIEKLQGEVNARDGAVLKLQKALDAACAQSAELERERDQWRDDCDSQCKAHKEAIGEMTAQHKQEIEKHRSALERQIERNGNLQRELLELYADLRAQDLPSLVLRICVSLTESECGLFVEADGDDTKADIGLHDLPDEVQEALYQWTRRAAEANAPVVQNDGQKLADGQNLVNLAAMPVAIHGTTKGVILVANKRGGSYTDEDTDLLLSIGSHAGIALENQRLHGALAESFQSTIAVLADAIEAKDAYTRGHCDSVAAMAVEIARRLGIEEAQVDQIRYAALLHDVGKIGIPDGVLLKPGKLVPEEYLMIQRHASIGSDLVGRVPSLKDISPIILHHHERIDGAGYPEGLSGDAIALSARIICVVDAFDAMTTPRPYREPVSHAEALEELQRCAGTHFDADVVKVMSEFLGESRS